MNKVIHLVSSLLATCLMVCLVAAQQQIPQQETQVLPINQAASVVFDNKTTCNSTSIKPKPETKKYVFKNCIVAQFAAYLTIGENKYIDFANGTVNNNLSKCENETIETNNQPKLVLDFLCGAQLVFNFGHDGPKTFVKTITGKYIDNQSQNQTFANTTQGFYTTLSGHYYECKSEQTIGVGTQRNLSLSDFAFEIYRSASSDSNFYQIAEECPLDSNQVSDLVRIGVGVCLIALVAIVLIAYFIGRRRWSERSSYESV